MKKKEEKEEKHIRFFCDKCSFEVPQDAIACPNCKCSFSSVKCPACGFTGRAELFGSGCPVCGYSMDKNQSIITATSSPAQGFQVMHDTQERSANADNANIMVRKARRSMEYGELPLWVYIITIIALLISFMALYLNIT
ncbi:MAG: zinc ribbon domain-containing protein [Treponema sp.]|jgi:hypothetical protein|nr:zinc ribbon domain-containing protein [Treponema sp.]